MWSVHSAHMQRLICIYDLQACKADQFRCRKIFQCVNEPARCNMVQDCLDMTDELECTRRDYIQALTPWRICDGTPDCPQWTDEIGCNYCANEVKQSGGLRYTILTIDIKPQIARQMHHEGWPIQDRTLSEHGTCNLQYHKLSVRKFRIVCS